ncbi:MAG: DNA-binding protein [Clostridiales Family XIII bacterium]|nr:DNA-binding protein [Clostridiales Family XIII bacterium]
MLLENASKMNLLYDFYGGLLKKGQRDVFRMYYAEDLSLAEIAADIRISRQGVHDALKRSAAALESYERALGLAEKYARAERTVALAGAALDRLAAERAQDAELANSLRDIRALLDSLEL